MFKLLIIVFLLTLTSFSTFFIAKDLETTHKESYDIALVKLQQKSDKQETFLNQFTPNFKNKVEYYSTQIKNVCTLNRQSKSEALFVFKFSPTDLEQNKRLAYRIFYYTIKYNLNYSIVESQPTFVKFNVVGEPYDIEGFAQHIRGAK